MVNSNTKPVLSVIIPTFNRFDTLKKALSLLLDQTLTRDKYELIVVNDGSTDNTREVVEDFRRSYPNVFYYEQNNLGPSAARNAGIRQATGSFIFFTGDDILASRGLLKAHLDCLIKNKGCAVLGLTQWDRELPVSDFMEYIMRHGHQFNYNGLIDGQECPWGMFYTSNISLSRTWFDKDMFDEKMPYPIWEDSELGYRLTKRGLRLIFNKEAHALHHHLITEKGFYNKIRQSGIVRTHFYSKHPELTTRLFFLARTAAALTITGFLKKISPILRFLKLRVLYWELNLYYYTVLGVHEGSRKGI